MSTQIKILGFLALLLFFFSCSKDDDNGGGSLTTIELTGIQNSPLVLENFISNPAVADYTVSGTWTIQAGVEIRPGVTIRMKPGSIIVVEGAGFLSAVGTAAEPILISGEFSTPGYWGYLLVSSNNNNNVLDHVILEYGGGNSSWDATIYCYLNGRIKIRNSSILSSGQNGIVVYLPDFSLDEFQNNTITNSAKAPIKLHAHHAAFLDATSTFSNNGNNWVEVFSGQITSNLSWKSLTIPYFFPDVIYVDANLNLEPGVRLLMGSNVHFNISSSGSIRSIGTPETRIQITAAQNTKGYWGGFRYTNSNNNLNEFQYTDLSYGGGDSSWDAILYLWDNSRLQIGNSSVANSQRWGIIAGSGNTLIDQGTNVFSGNELGDIQN